MKTVFNSLDLAAAVQELKSLHGMRINQIYDIDHKTYIFRFHSPNKKTVLLIESGSRIHITTYTWPKSPCPSGFTMKLRKHLSNKRLENINQLGNDRIVIMQFGVDIAMHYLIVEFFQRGNIILTDNTMSILSVLTPHKEKNVRFAVREKYPMDRAHEKLAPPTFDKLQEMKANAKKDATIHKSLLPVIDFGASLIEHALVLSGLAKNTKFSGDIPEDKLKLLEQNLLKAEEIFNEISTKGCKGYIIKQTVKNVDGTDIENYLEFHPYLFKQFENSQFSEYDTFNDAVDDFFSKIESQSIEMKAVMMEKEVLSKVEKIKQNQDSRIYELTVTQETDKKKADLIMCNSDIVGDAILIINSALAAQMDWSSIDTMVKNAQSQKDPVALIIKSLNFQTNHITLLLRDIYDDVYGESEPTPVDIDLALSAHANAKQYYNHKKYAAQKEKKTLESQDKALVSAQKKARTALKEIKTLTTIKKIQKPYWFEKFYWFISSENYLVIGGRDQAQNELIVKRYMTAGDLYVHADIHGASNVVIKNPSGKPVPIKTLNEAGTMAVCCSVGWDAKILCSAWWVTHEQVSKTAPTGEYLQTGSFMVRGHKNYLLPAQLAMGCGFLFRVSDSSAERHKDERRVRNVENIYEQSTSENKGTDDSRIEDDRQGEKSDNTSGVEEQTVRLEEQFETLSVSSKSSGDDDNENKDTISLSKDECDDSGKGQPLQPDKSASDVNRNDSDDEDDSGNEGPSLQCEEEKSDVKKDKLEIYDDDSGNEGPPLQSEEDNDLKQSDNKNIKAKQKPRNTNKNVNQQRGQKEEKQTDFAVPSNSKQAKETAPLKRGQRSKLKKIKEKYKDQDEEEKKLRMLVLASAGEKKLTKKEKKNLKNQKPQITEKPKFKKPAEVTQKVKEPEDLDELEQKIQTDLDALAVLTGQPYPDDELLYSLPVIAPYSTLLNYKFKLKLVPGTTKKGKAAKLAVETFIRNEECTQREKELIKTVDCQKFATNFPGKVKISVPISTKKKKNPAKPSVGGEETF
ncbi:nuclear export mediator factor NEMF homolog [Cimex lectularius]|uniref:Nuclear export mediator factor NEMF homolog n=1 Tax=Cimex lectularius TaxID=79782 RepID=A0A8I6RT69_CIMLE|nr:nuclear export mediator factor NEMF homolog [Cimex lectularius]